MKKYYSTTLLLITLLLFGCANSGSESSDTSEAKGVDIEITQLAQSTDPVCNMSLKDHVIADTVTHHGGLYGFCNSGCKQAFLEDPHKYLGAH